MTTLWLDTHSSERPGFATSFVVPFFEGYYTSEGDNVFILVDVNNYYRVKKHAYVAVERLRQGVEGDVLAL